MKKLSLLEKFGCSKPVMLEIGLEVKQDKLELAAGLFVNLGFKLVSTGDSTGGGVMVVLETTASGTPMRLRLTEPEKNSLGQDSRRYTPNVIFFEVPNITRIHQVINFWAFENHEKCEIDYYSKTGAYVYLRELLCFSIELVEIRGPVPEENKWLYEKNPETEGSKTEVGETSEALAPTGIIDLSKVPHRELLD